jgi:uncharacterized protein
MLITAELLLQYHRCRRKTFLDIHGDLSQRDAPSELLLKLRQDKSAHQQTVLAQQPYHRPEYPKGNWPAGATATLELMQQGVDCIHKGVVLANSSEEITLLSSPDLLVKQPGKSWFGDWIYVPAQIELGKRPKLEYQIVAAFHAQVLATVQGVQPDIAWLLLRRKDAYQVNLAKWIPQMQSSLKECIQTLVSPQPPDVFISRQRCSLCHWFNQCYAIAKSQQHLSLLPGVSPNRYIQLQALNIISLESLAQARLAELENLPGFDSKVAQQLVLQAQSVVENRPILLTGNVEPIQTNTHPTLSSNAPVELYFDIEAQPDLNLDYMLGVLVVDNQTKTKTFHSLLAERPEEEESIWQQFLDLVWQYPLAPIFHFCAYELDTVKRLAKLYNTPTEQIRPLLERFVDVYEQVTQTVTLPVESYALKAIARWLGFEWRDPQANGSKCIYWYDQWLETGDRTFLNSIQHYNEDDCRATHHVKDWLINFVDAYPVSCRKPA